VLLSTESAGEGRNLQFCHVMVNMDLPWNPMIVEQRILSTPASIQSIPAAADQEDFVSMGMTAANKLLRVLENTRNVLAIEALAVAQALDFRAPLKTGKRGQAAHAAIRTVSPTVSQDRILTDDFRRVADLIANGKLADALR